MRLLLAHPFSSWNGVRRGGERYLDDLLAWAVAAGHEVTVATRAAGTAGSVSTAGPAREYRHGGARVLEVAAPDPYGDFGPALRQVLQADRPYDVVHALEAPAALAAAGAGLPVVFSVLGLPRGPWLASHPSYRAELRAAGAASAVTCALTDVAATAVREAAGLADVTVLPPGLRGELFPLATGPRRPEVLYVSVVSEQRKRFAALVEALEQVPEVGLVVAAAGDPGPVLRRHPAVAARTRVPGAGDPAALPRLYGGVAVTAMPSVDEAFGLVVVESLACGTPVLAAPGSGPAELLADAGAGVGVAVDDLAGGLRSLLAAPPDPLKCREHAMRWDWSVVGPRHEQVWRSAV